MNQKKAFLDLKKFISPFRMDFTNATDAFLVAQLLRYEPCPREDLNLHVAWSQPAVAAWTSRVPAGTWRHYASYVRTLDPGYW